MTSHLHKDELPRLPVPSAGEALAVRIAAATRHAPQRLETSLLPSPLAGWIYAASTGLGIAAGFLVPFSAPSGGATVVLALIYGGWL